MVDDFRIPIRSKQEPLGKDSAGMRALKIFRPKLMLAAIAKLTIEMTEKIGKLASGQTLATATDE